MDESNPYQGYGRAIKKMLPWAIVGGVTGGLSRFAPALGYVGWSLMLCAIFIGVREMTASRP
jgi:hypothetical protein